MKFRIPFALVSDVEISKRRSKKFLKFARQKKGNLDEYLKDSENDITGRQYLSICYRSFCYNLLFLTVITTTIMGVLGTRLFYLYGLILSFFISGFILINQLYYPKMFSSTKAKNVEKNLITVLQDMVVQLNSGIPMFNIIANIADSDYAELSEEFKKITKQINAGTPQIEAIENYGKITNSKYLKRVLWQISNGMRAGSDMTTILKEGIKNLSEEQAIQIQQYAGKLNPLIMFYMLVAIILPSLGITFLIIISSIMDISSDIMKFIFFGILGGVTFIQVMFLGIIKSRRPSLL